MTLLEELAGHFDSGPSAANPFALTIEERLKLPFNDMGNASRLMSAFGRDLVFVSGMGWAVWNGRRFSFDSGAHMAAGIAAQLPKLITEEIEAINAFEVDQTRAEHRLAQELRKRSPEFTSLRNAQVAVKDERIKNHMSQQVKCGNLDRTSKALKDCERRVVKNILDLDTDPGKLVVQNGVLDLDLVAACPAPETDKIPSEIDLTDWRTPWLTPPDRSFFPTKCAGTSFVPSATCPEWDRFISLILPDPKIRHCLQRICGSLLYGANLAQAVIMIRGSGGNGKSTLISVLGKVLGVAGGYAAPCKIEMFLETQTRSAGQATPEEVDLPGARALLASEPGPTDTLSAKRLKALTGGDLRPIRALGKAQMLYRPTGTPVIQFNRTPRIKDEDQGTKRRLVFLPMEVDLRRLPPEHRRHPLQIETALSVELPGILNWMLDGYRDFRARLDAGLGTPPGIDPPKTMLSLKETLMETADPVGSFLKACTDPHTAGRTRTQEFFRAFNAWARDNGARAYSNAAVRAILTEKGFGKIKSNGRMCFAGFNWKDDPLVETYRQEPGQFGS